MSEPRPTSAPRPARLLLVLVVLMGLFPGKVSRPDESFIDPAQTLQAVKAGIKIIQKAARSYPEHRTCFSCHHQTLPLQAMVIADRRGVDIDRVLLKAQGDFTHESFRRRVAGMREGEGIGGASMTVGYGLWTLDLVGRRRDPTSHAMVSFLLRKQESDGSWNRSTRRPPLEDSNVTCTVLAAHYMRRFCSHEQRNAVNEAIGRAKTWLLTVTPQSTEDRNSLLGGLALIQADKERVEAAKSAVLQAQRADGGWAQIPEMESDAYATGQTLFTLQRVGVSTQHPAFVRGVAYLLRTQHSDGSWFVKSRSKPIQRLFDNGDPHGKHQFISIAATSWATAAVALSLPAPKLRGF